MRNDDYSKPKELSHEVTCYNCQKPAQRQKKTFYGSKPGERYIGNLEIYREVPKRREDGKIFYETTCYTGKYVMKFGNFCSVKCGLIWANHQIEERRERRRTENFGPGSAVKPDQQRQLAEMKRKLEGKG
jgi:endogenous inhibitor of DNA gyrase (YacG/DUF329 family)|tara:strand:+ start:1855 stop:2244 length:390 start_codon:yes stop_codon:yes gene_type:complete